MGSKVDIHKIVQIALLGQVPPTLRFVYAHFKNNEFEFNAVFTEDAPEEHINAVEEAFTEICSHFSSKVKIHESFELSNSKPWKVGNGSNLMYLRFGEYSDT